jgi:hypothetical protein
MKRIWNYFFYSTWKIQDKFARNFIEKPLIEIFSLIPYFKNNWEKGRKAHQIIMHSKNYGTGIGFAFSFMFLTTCVIYLCICILLTKVLTCETSVESGKYFFFGIIGLSYLTNQMLLYSNDTYKRYFDEFEKVDKKTVFLLSAIAFHLGVVGIGILFIYYFVGFKL